MNPFKYSFAEAKKFWLAFALFVGTGLVYVLHFDPSFAEALQVLVGSGFAVVGVFTAPQFSEADFSKVITAAIGALFAVYKFFGQVDAGTELQIYTWAGTAVSMFTIWWVGNAGHRTPGDATLPPTG
jgi:hypothetical protein